MRVERTDIQQLIQQMQGMRDQVKTQSPLASQLVNGEFDTQKISGSGTKESPFVDLFKGALDNVNKVQQESSSMAKAYEMGDPSVDLTRVMIASQKASISFQATMQVRNKLINAYQDIMNMPI